MMLASALSMVAATQLPDFPPWAQWPLYAALLVAGYYLKSGWQYVSGFCKAYHGTQTVLHQQHKEIQEALQERIAIKDETLKDVKESFAQKLETAASQLRKTEDELTEKQVSLSLAEKKCKLLLMGVDLAEQCRRQIMKHACLAFYASHKPLAALLDLGNTFPLTLTPCQFGFIADGAGESLHSILNISAASSMARVVSLFAEIFDSDPTLKESEIVQKAADRVRSENLEEVALTSTGGLKAAKAEYEKKQREELEGILSLGNLLAHSGKENPGQ